MSPLARTAVFSCALLTTLCAAQPPAAPASRPAPPASRPAPPATNKAGPAKDGDLALGMSLEEVQVTFAGDKVTLTSQQGNQKTYTISSTATADKSAAPAPSAPSRDILTFTTVEGKVTSWRRLPPAPDKP